VSDDDSQEQLLSAIETMHRNLARLERRLEQMSRYLRDEGYGDGDTDDPTDLDDD